MTKNPVLVQVPNQIPAGGQRARNVRLLADTA